MASPLDQRRDAILRRLPRNAVMAEVGVLVGRLSGALLRARCDLTLYMVDNWLPMDAQAEAYRATRDEAAQLSIEKAEQHRREAEAVASRHPGQAFIIADHSIAAASRFDDRSFDMVFLDADHSEDGVRADIAAWLPKVKPGGWIGGHDMDNDDPRYDFSGVRRAVEAWCPHYVRDANFTWWAQV